MHTQAFRKISQVVNFKLFPCDLSPPLKPAVGGFSKDRKMSYTHPNSIPSVAMGSRRHVEQRPILIFLGRSTVTFQLPTRNLQIQISWSLLIRLENWR
jgi:hypothetical protein